MPGSLVGDFISDPRRPGNNFVQGFEIVLGLVVVATFVAALAEKLRAPAPSLLALAGLAVGTIPGVPDVHLSPQLVALGVLPPLLYAAATDVAVSELIPVLRSVSVLAVGLVAASAVAVCVVAHTVFPQVSLTTGLVLGAVLASTDPIAVGALARRLDLPPRLLALVQGESLLNDATSLVLFRVAVGLAAAGSGASVLGTTSVFLRLGAGGALVGLAAAVLNRSLRRRVHDPVVETVMALVVPYAVYVAAESLGTSGVTAVVVAGLQLGQRAEDLDVSSARTRLQISTVYSVTQFLLESAIFAVIGLQLPTLIRRLSGADRHFVLGSLAIIAVVISVRALWIYPTAFIPPLVRRLRRREPTLASPEPNWPRWQVPTVICWVGTRGVVPLTAALSIPLTIRSGDAFPHRDLLLVLTSSCILITLVVQGLTLAPLVRRLGVVDDPATRRREQAQARLTSVHAAIARLDELLDLEAVPEVVTSQLRIELHQRLARAKAALDATRTDQPTVDGRRLASRLDPDLTYRAVRRDLLAAEAAALFSLRDEGLITESVRRQVQRALDMQEIELEE